MDELKSPERKDKDREQPGGEPRKGAAEEGKRESGGDETDELRLWRLLTTPEELLEEEPALPGAVPERKAPEPPADAGGEAIPLEREAAPTIYCRNHPDRPAIAQCPVCGSYYCRDCMVIKKGRLLCKTCAETEFAPTEEEVMAKGEDAFQLRGDFLPEAPPVFNPAGSAEGGEAHLAHPLKRILVFIIDVALARVAYFVVFVVFSTFLAAISLGHIPSVLTLGHGSFGLGVKVLALNLLHFRPLPVLLVLDFLYFFTSYFFFNRTLGMNWANLRIVTLDGDFVGVWGCALRAFLLVFTLGLGIIFALVHPQRMGLHDMLAQTYVINYSGLKRVDPLETITVKM